MNFPTILPSSIENDLFYYGIIYARARVYCITFLIIRIFITLDQLMLHI
jgi:hypothetical protein